MRGHQVAFIAPHHYPLVRQFSIGELFECPEPDNANAGSGEAKTFASSLAIRGMLQPDYLRAAVSAETRVIDDWRPDLIFTENQISIAISARRSGVPYLATVASINLDTFDESSQGRDTDLTSIWAIEDEWRLVPSVSIEGLLHGHATLNVAPTAPTLEPALMNLPNIKFVGALLFPPIELAKGVEFASTDKVRLVVYLSTGLVTLHNAGVVLAEAFPAKDFEVCVAVRSRAAEGISDFERMYGIRVFALPGMTTSLRRCDLLLTRGGQNALMAALLAGKPIIGTPGWSAEPTFNLRMLESLGAAKCVPGVPTVDDLVAAYIDVVNSETTEMSRQLGDILREYGGPSELVRSIEKLI